MAASAPLRAALACSLVLGCYHGLEPGEGPAGATEGSSGAATSTSSAATSTSSAAATSTGTDTGLEGSSTAGVLDTGESTQTGTSTTDPGTSSGPSTTSTDTGSSSSTTSTTTTTGDPPPPDETAMICQRWKDDRANLSEGAWSGDANGCDPGDVAAPGRDNTRKLVNLYRFLAGLPPVTEDPSWSTKAQACALMMHANMQLSHSPPMNWKCYSAAGAEAAGKSNIATTPAVAAIDLYVADFGNATTIGHRRWILSNSLSSIGIGSTSAYSCLWVIGGQGDAGAPWIAWPPEGIVPLDALEVDQTGWTVQSDSIDLGPAQVKITEGGVDKPVKVTPLLGGYGSQSAISMIPQGWTTQAGKTYTVQVSGVTQPFSYDVQVVQCP